jgi:DNA-binding transcriptional ArsR family regulator
MWKRYKLLYDFNDRSRREIFLAMCCQCRRCAIWCRPIVEREHLDEKHSPLLVADYEGLEPKFRQQITNRLRRPRISAEKLWIMLDNKSCQGYNPLMLDIQVIDDPAAATVALEPMRSRLLSELAAPASAATLATRVGLARQKVNYHLHALEAHGLVRLAEKRKWGGLTERLLVATAASYVVSPSALGPIAVDPNREVDRLSASYLIALGARVVREVGDLVRRAKETGKRLATLAVDTEVRFRSATDRAAFSNELTEAITKLVSKYHDESAPGGRAHRLVVVAHPLPQKSDPKEPS